MAGSQESSPASSKAAAILAYTLLRVALFAVVWVVIELLSPIHGLWAAASAIIISGVISVVVLDRQRAAVGSIAAGFFGRINARIEASARAEDDTDTTAEPPPAPSDSGDGEGDAEGKPVDQQ